MKPAEIERRLTAQDLAQPEGVAPAMRAGARRASREESDQFYGRQSRAYLVVRLKCDNPAVRKLAIAAHHELASLFAQAAVPSGRMVHRRAIEALPHRAPDRYIDPGPTLCGDIAAARTWLLIERLAVSGFKGGAHSLALAFCFVFAQAQTA